MSTLIEKEVQETLSVKILPSIVASRVDAPRSWKWADGFHSIFTEIVSALFALGIATSPLFRAIAVHGTPARPESWAGVDLVTITGAVLWTTFVVVLKNRKIPEKLIQREECRKAFRALGDELQQILSEDENPKKALIELSVRVRKARTQHLESFFAEPDASHIRAHARKEAAEQVEQYKGFWRDDLGEVRSGPVELIPR